MYTPLGVKYEDESFLTFTLTLVYFILHHHSRVADFDDVTHAPTNRVD